MSVGLTPPGCSDSFAALKRKFEEEDDEEDNEDEGEEDSDGKENPKQSLRVQFKIPRRSGLTEIFHFANLTEESNDSRLLVKFFISRHLIERFGRPGRVHRRLNRGVSVRQIFESIQRPSANQADSLHPTPARLLVVVLFQESVQV